MCYTTMKSTKAYVHIRKQGLLPLPSPSTIRRLVSSSEFKLGFNTLPREHISDALKDLKVYERWGVLMWDEMAVTKDLKFDPRNLKWKGIVDLAGACSVMVSNGIADHVLVFVFWPFLQGWIQPFAWFETKGAHKRCCADGISYASNILFITTQRIRNSLRF